MQAMVCRKHQNTNKEKNMHTILFAAAAYLVGVFTPSVSREVKSWFSKEGAKVEADAKADVKKL
jgi:hypothetical protein